MNKERLVRTLQQEIPLPKWLGTGYRFQIGTVLETLFRISCWTAVVWLVWNHALMNFLNFDGIGPVLSFGIGAFMHAMATILEDGESQ